MDDAQNSERPGQLIITGGFNGLLDRLAKIDYFEVWLTGKKILKMAKKERKEATMRLSQVCFITGLTKEDMAFFISIRLIECVEATDDLLLSFKDVFWLVKIFERFVDEGAISRISAP